MKRGRTNRRKPPEWRMPALPRVSINWRAWLAPPLAVFVALAFFTVGRAAVDRPVGKLIVQGTFERVTPVQVEAALAPDLDRQFLELDLNRLSQSIADLDWVDSVAMERLWPESLKVTITEQQAAASWGDSGLLNTRGELFVDDARFEYPELPKLAGPEGSEQRVARLYLDVRGRLADANLFLEAIRMDERGALDITVASGQQFRLGRRDLNVRLDRLFEVALPALAVDFGQVDYIDLRYPNGFAVGWRQPEVGPETEEPALG